MLNQCLTGGAVANHNVEHSLWQKLRCNLGHQQRGGRGGVGWLQHDGVSGGNGRCKFPGSHNHRVIPRSDLTDYPDRLAANRRGVVADVFSSGATLEVSGGTGKEANLAHNVVHLVRNHEAARFTGVTAFGVG